MKQSALAAQGIVQAPATGLQVPNDGGQSVSLRHSTHRCAEGSQMIRKGPLSVQSALARQLSHRPVEPSQWCAPGDGHSRSDLQPRQARVVESQTGLTTGQTTVAEQGVILGEMTSEIRSPHEACPSSVPAVSSHAQRPSRGPNRLAAGERDGRVEELEAVSLMGAASG